MNKRQYSTWTFGNPMSLRFEDGGDGTTPAWHADFPSLADNPESSKKMSKYLTADAAMAGAVDAQEKAGKAYFLPDDHSKLTDEHKAEIRANVAKMNGVPETPEGYGITTPDGAIIDDQAISELKAFAHKNGYTKEQVQGLVDLQVGFVNRINTTTDETIGTRIKDGFTQYAKEVGGEATAALHMEWVKRYLKSKSTVEGTFNQEMWDGFEKRNFYNNQGKELVLLRALKDSAQQHEATGGGAGSVDVVTPDHKGSLQYPEMKK